MEQLIKNPRIEVVDALRGFAVMAIILVHNLEHFIFSGLAERFRPRSIQRDFHPLCREGVCDFRPLVRIYVLYTNQQPKEAREGFRLPVLVASGTAGGFCDIECGLFPGRRRLVVVRGGRARTVLYKKLERQGYLYNCGDFLVTTSRMVPLYCQPGKSGAPVARP